MLLEERQKKILEFINRQGHISVHEMSTLFSISTMTAWRDLQTLEEKKYLRRVRGGAVRNVSFKPTEPEYELKESLYIAEKERIAHYAASSFVKDGDIIILEGGTTVACMVPELKSTRVTILTNGLNSITKAMPYLPYLTVICCGGILRDISHTFVGPQAETFFSGFHANRLFLSGHGFTLENGLTDPHPLDIQVKRAMVRAVDEVIVLLDSSKIGYTSLMPIIPMTDIDVFITDRSAPIEFLDKMRDLGLDVRVAD
jgi:DeoR/GlpR family transcriptional regulator of sugar metabolism